MRDVIVVGAGAGGPVVAKELAARGLDVLLLEAGAHYTDPRGSWTHYQNDANNPLTGFLRFGPADREKPAWLREEPQNSYVLQVAGVGGTTQHYYGNSPRAYRGVFAGYEGADRAAYDTAHAFPFGYSELVPYYEWVEATLPVQTAAMGTKETVFFRGAERFLARKAAELLRKAGARKLYRFDWAPLMLHVHSTMRMGASEHDSVLDANAESRWVRQLYVADNSALPNSLGGPTRRSPRKPSRPVPPRRSSRGTSAANRGWAGSRRSSQPTPGSPALSLGDKAAYDPE